MYCLLLPTAVYWYGAIRDEAKAQIRDLGGDLLAPPPPDSLLANADGDVGRGVSGTTLSAEDPQPRPQSTFSAGPLAAVLAPVTPYEQLSWLSRQVITRKQYEASLRPRRSRSGGGGEAA